MKLKSKIICFLLLFFSTTILGQIRGKVYGTRSLSLGVGVSTFMGDIRGRNATGNSFLYDFKKIAANFSYRYFFSQNYAIRMGGSFGNLQGDDALTEEIHRKNRNLSFRSLAYEGMISMEYHHRFYSNSLKDFQPYVGVGIGVFYFNPQAKLGGNWVDLQPLGTEGQGLSGNDDFYNRVAVTFPLTWGFSYGLDNRWSIGLETGYRKTTTDYIDDVSTVYGDVDQIRSERGDIAAYFADRSLNLLPNQNNPGTQRGNPNNNDTYFLTTVNLTYTIYNYFGHHAFKKKVMERRKKSRYKKRRSSGIFIQKRNL